MESFKSILESNGIYLTDSIYRNLEMLSKSPETHTHVAFLLDQYGKLLSYKPNVFFKTDCFPFSQHAEIATIVNYYSTTKSKRSTKSTPKILLVVQLRTKIFGESRPCKGCAQFILNNWDNLKLKHVMYSRAGSTFSYIRKRDLQTEDFSPSRATVFANY